jgi:hypothetical protein
VFVGVFVFAEVRFRASKGFSLHAACALKAGDVVYSDEMQPLCLITKSYAQHDSAAFVCCKSHRSC